MAQITPIEPTISSIRKEEFVAGTITVTPEGVYHDVTAESATAISLMKKVNLLQVLNDLKTALASGAITNTEITFDLRVS